MYYLVQNDGLVIEDDFILLGGSTKRENQQKFRGFFGSGAKHFIAYALREKIPFVVFSGLNQIEFGVKPKDYRGQLKNIIVVNGKETPITTDFGPDWDAWQSLREIITNALDEENPYFGFSETAQPVEGKTRIYIYVNEKINEILTNFGNYFCYDKSADYSEKNEIEDDSWMKKEQEIRFFAKEKISPVTIFRKGVRCSEGNMRNSHFDYDLSDIAVNESRIMKSTYSALCKIGSMIASSDNMVLIKKFIELGLNNQLYESQISFSHAKFNDTWHSYLRDKTIVPQSLIMFIPLTEFANPIVLNDSLYNVLSRQFDDLKKYENYLEDNVVFKPEIDPILYKRIEKCYSTISLVYPNIKPIKFQIVKFSAENIMGSASKGTIMLSVKLATESDDYLLNTILEEYFHLISGYGDLTRSFETYLINQVANQIRKIELQTTNKL